MSLTVSRIKFQNFIGFSYRNQLTYAKCGKYHTMHRLSLGYPVWGGTNSMSDDDDDSMVVDDDDYDHEVQYH